MSGGYSRGAVVARDIGDDGLKTGDVESARSGTESGVRTHVANELLLDVDTELERSGASGEARDGNLRVVDAGGRKGRSAGTQTSRVDQGRTWCRA